MSKTKTKTETLTAAQAKVMADLDAQGVLHLDGTAARTIAALERMSLVSVTRTPAFKFHTTSYAVTPYTRLTVRKAA